LLAKEHKLTVSAIELTWYCGFRAAIPVNQEAFRNAPLAANGGELKAHREASLLFWKLSFQAPEAGRILPRSLR